jgi:hypothetical protein
MYIVHCTLYIVHCTLYTVHCTLHIAHCTLYIVHCTLYIVHCTLYIVYCILYIVYNILAKLWISLHYSSPDRNNIASIPFRSCYWQANFYTKWICGFAKHKQSPNKSGCSTKHCACQKEELKCTCLWLFVLVASARKVSPNAFRNAPGTHEFKTRFSLGYFWTVLYCRFSFESHIVWNINDNVFQNLLKI